MSAKRPALPKPQPITVDVKKTALLVLDLSEQCADPQQPCHQLVPGVKQFLARAREAGLFIVFTIPVTLKDTPLGKVFSGFEHKASEPVIFPNGYDKFLGDELEALLGKQEVDTLIITGSRFNICVLYTATRAARNFKHNVIIPVDGVRAKTDYEYEYTLHQLTVLPGGVSERISFTTLEGISFR